MHERWNELERGKSAQETKRKHIPTWLFKMADNLDYLYNQLLRSIENINIIGIKKHKEEAVTLLSEFVPKARKFSAKVNSYNDYINELEERVSIQKTNSRKLSYENQELKEKVVSQKFETGEKLRQMQMQVDKYQNYIKKVPKDIIDEIERKDLERQREKQNKERWEVEI